MRQRQNSAAEDKRRATFDAGHAAIGQNARQWWKVWRADGVCLAYAPTREEAERLAAYLGAGATVARKAPQLGSTSPQAPAHLGNPSTP